MDKNFYVKLTMNGTETYYKSKADAIIAITTNLAHFLKTELYDVNKLNLFKSELELVVLAESGGWMAEDLVKYEIVVKPKETEENTISTVGYVFSTDLPKSFHIELNSAKVELLLEVLDTYIKIGKSNEDIGAELVEDLFTLLNKEEPYIAGCGQITKVVSK